MQSRAGRLKAIKNQINPLIGYPSLDINFAAVNEILDSRITFTRASSATRTNASGVIETVLSDVARFDYDPETLAPKGLLIEEQRTNLLTYSSEFENTTWNKNASIVITANANTAPDGTMTADEFSGSLVNCGVWRVPTTTASIPHIYSIYLKNVNNATNLLVGCDINPTNAFIRFNSVTGVITSAAGNVTSSSVIAIGNGWYRVTVGFVPTTTQPTFVLYSTSGASATWLVWGAQLELGSFATSVIPTTSATVTRAADNASMVGSNFSSWYNQSAGTFGVNGDIVSNSGDRLYFDVGANGAFGTTAYTVQTSTYVGLLPGTAPVNMASTVNTTTLTNKIATAMQNNNSTIAVNASLGVVDAACTMPASATTLTIGCSQFGGTFGNYLNGHIQSIKYYPTRLPNGTLQGLTA